MNNGYSSATGQQDILSSKEEQDGRGKGLDIEAALEEPGRAVDQARAHLWRGGRASTPCARPCAPAQKGLKVIIADGECQLARQRRIRPGDRAQGGAPASAWCARASGSTRRCAPATTPASASRAAPRSPSSPTRTRCAPIPSPTSTTTASAAGCAARSRTRRSSARRSRRSTSSRTRAAWDRLKRRLSAALMRLLGGGARRRAPPPPRAGGVSRGARQSPSRLLIAALGGEGGGVLASWLHRGGHRQRPLRAGHLDPRRRPAHGRHHLLSRDRARCRRAPPRRRRAPRAGAQCGARRGRPGGRQRAAGGDAGHRQPASSRPTARC